MDELMIPVMQVSVAPIVVIQSSQIIFGEGAINIADDQLIHIGVQVDLSSKVEVAKSILQLVLPHF